MKNFKKFVKMNNFKFFHFIHFVRFVHLCHFIENFGKNEKFPSFAIKPSAKCISFCCKDSSKKNFFLK